MMLQDLNHLNINPFLCFIQNVKTYDQNEFEHILKLLIPNNP